MTQAAAPASMRGRRPPERISAVVLDLDGTCLDVDDQFLHPRTREAVRAVAARIPVIVATGRMYRSAVPWCEQLGVTAPAVCYQGALIREMPPPAAAGAVLRHTMLDGATAAEALHVARDNNWHFQAYQDDELLCEQDRPEAHLYARIAGVDIHFVPDLEPLLHRGSTKVICVIEDTQQAERCMDVMRRTLGRRARVTSSLPQFIEMVNPDVNKAVACELVCRHLGVRLRDAVAIDDALNDTEVLDAAGWAVAIRTAPPSVIAHADATCAPPRQAGVADALTALSLL